MRKSLNSIVFSILLLFLHSCRENSNYTALDAELPPNISSTTGSRQKTSKLQLLVTELSNLDRLEGKYIGLGGTESKQKDYVQELIWFANTDSLIMLTSHKSPIVRIISFRALNAKGYPNCKEILRDHIEDNQTYSLFAGCLITPEPVNLTMYNTIKAQLSSVDRATFGKLIKAQLHKSKYYARNFFDASI